MDDPRRKSRETSALSLKSPPSLSIESPSLLTSATKDASRPDQARNQSGSERDEGDNSNAFAVALDPVVAPAEDSALFYSGEMVQAFGHLCRSPWFDPRYPETITSRSF